MLICCLQILDLFIEKVESVHEGNLQVKESNIRKKKKASRLSLMFQVVIWLTDAKDDLLPLK